MVVSKIDKSIEYPAVKFVDLEDLNYDAQLYELELFPGLEVIIALGNVKYTYVDKKVLYIPVYLTKDSEVLMQIGVYEFPADIYTSLLDDDNDFDISLLENPLPLLYKFVTESLIKKETKQTTKKNPEKSTTEKSTTEKSTTEKSTTEKSTTEKSTETQTMNKKENKKENKKGNNEENDDDLSEDSRVPNNKTILELLEEDDDEAPVISDKNVAEEIKQSENFKAHRGHNWVERFMTNENYGIIDNEGGGDCLFAVIRDAFEGINKKITVTQLRNIISEEATEQIFLNFKEQYTMYTNEIIQLKQQMLDLKKKHNKLKSTAGKIKDRSEKKKIVNEAKIYISQFKQSKLELDNANSLLHEYRWMKNISNLIQFKQKIKTCGFWAESWAINVLEVALNIKLIILSSNNYRHKDYENVLLCGEMVNPMIERKGFFKPKYYIILDHTGDHYKLITYKMKKILTFDDISVKLKTMIIDKCMEKPSGIYNYIPKFKILKTRIKDNKDDSGIEDQGLPDKEKQDEGADLSKKPPFDNTTVFQFYSKSSDKPLPGRGAGEKINPKNHKIYLDLASMIGWRKILSNFYMAPFKMDGRTWNSVEHYYHANKFKKSHPEFYEKFTIESNSDISKDPAFAKAAGGKSGKYKPKQWQRPKNITIDEDFFIDGRNQKVMEDGQFAKYSQNELTKKVLLATKDAKLQHHVRAQPPIIFYDTMRIREQLKSN